MAVRRSAAGNGHPSADRHAMRQDRTLDRSHRFFDKIFRNIWYRKAYHFLAGAVLVALVAILDTTWVFVLGLSWLAAFGILSQRISTSVLGLLLLNLLPDSYVTRLGATVVFVVGDGFATVVGTAFGSRRWPWSGHKTVLGSASFLISATLAMAAVLHFAVQSAPQSVLAVAFWPSLAGCLVEAVPIPLVVDVRDLTPDDNLAVVLASGGVLHFLTNCAV